MSPHEKGKRVDFAARLATQKHTKAHSERSSCTDLVLEKLYLLITGVAILTSLGVGPYDWSRAKLTQSGISRRDVQVVILSNPQSSDRPVLGVRSSAAGRHQGSGQAVADAGGCSISPS